MPVATDEVRVLAVTHNLIFSAVAIFEFVAEKILGNADILLAVEAGAALSAGTLVISGRAIVESVTAEPVVDAAASVAFIVPFVAARNASGGAVDFIFATRTVIVCVADPVLRDTDVTAYAVKVSLRAVGAVNFILASHAVGHSVADVAIWDAISVMALEGSGQAPQLLRGDDAHQQQRNDKFTDHGEGLKT